MPLITSLPVKALAPGIAGHYAHGDKCTLGLVKLEKGRQVPLHNHVHEQITYIVKGQLQMMIDGKDCLLEQGMYYVIPSNVMHSAVALTDCQVIDVFAPVREDYKTQFLSL